MTDQHTNTFLYRKNEIFYRTVGSGPPLIFLHGWGSDSRVMLPLARNLARIRTCYLPDLPGFGQTSPPSTAWSVDDYADMVQAFIDNHGLAPVDLLVHSFGGRIALKLCARSKSQNNISKVLITAGAGMRPRRSWRYYTKKYFAKALKIPFKPLPASLQEKALLKLRSTALWKKLGSNDYQKLSGTMRKIFVKTVTDHLDEILPHIEQEILLIWGNKDSVTPLYQGKRMEKKLENSALVTISHAGHYTFLDRPTHFTRIATSFFSAKEKEQSES